MARDRWGYRQLPRAHEIKHERRRSCYGQHQSGNKQAERQGPIFRREVLGAPADIIRHTAKQPHDQVSRGTDSRGSIGIVEKLPEIRFDFGASRIANRSRQSARVEPRPTPDQAGGSHDPGRSHDSLAGTNYRQIYALRQPTSRWDPSLDLGSWTLDLGPSSSTFAVPGPC